MLSEENIMSINKIVGVKREEKKGRHSGKGAVVGALSTVCLSLCVRGVDLDHSTTWLSKACTKRNFFFPILMPGRVEFLSL